ncbi:MAG: hypothetical protein ACRDFC_00330, partial [Ignavibacteria bacterium]
MNKMGIYKKLLQMLPGIICLTFLTVIVYSFSTGITNLTRRTTGAGCFCHDFSPSVSVSIT